MTHGWAGLLKGSAQTMTKFRALLTLIVPFFAILLIASPASAKPVPVHWGDTLSGIVVRECGSNDWGQAARDNARTNPDPDLIYAGQTLQVNCGSPAAAAATPVPAAPTSGWVAPVSACISSGFGWRASTGSMHNGVDLAASYGTAIKAAHSGTLSVGYQSGGAGNYSMIIHGDGLATVYMHESSFQVRSGWVNTGQVIGYVGSIGNSTGPHLHFETHTGGLWNNRVNPIRFMSARGVGLRWC